MILMVQWSFSRAGFRLNSDNLLAPLAINRTEVLAQISVPEMSPEQLVPQYPTEVPASDGRSVPRRARIPAPVELAVSLKVYIDEKSGFCPLCGHRDHERSSKYEKETEEQILPF
jgi:hypothetical protein